MSRPFCTCVLAERPRRLAMMVTGLLSALLALNAAPARAASDTYRQDGVTLRLIALPPNAQGILRGALTIDLDPGWKTYWIAPGPVGLAPQLDFSGSSSVVDPVISFPAPVRFSEGAAESLGYTEPTAFAIRATTQPGAASTLKLTAFLGVCRELCVPVQATLSATPSSSLSDRAAVTRAEGDVPAEAGPLAVRSARWSGDGTSLLVTLPPIQGNRAIDAFVSVGDGWSFGAPTTEPDGSETTLALPVLSRPAGAELRSADILLTAGETAQLSRAVPIVPH